MNNRYLPIHQTQTRRFQDVEGGGWEFYCQECGYHARYIASEPTGQPKLEILNAGDLEARHTSQQIDEMEAVSSTLKGDFDQENTPGPVVDESWMTPETREFLKRLLNLLDD